MPETAYSTEQAYSRYEEAAVLGSMILDGNCIPAVLEWVNRESFVFDEHRPIFEAVLSVWRRNPGGALDGVLVRSELERTQTLEAIGGLDYLREVMETTPSSANALYYARLVVERQRYRAAAAAVAEMAKALDAPGELDERIRHVQELALDLQPQQAEPMVFPVADHAANVAVAVRDRQHVTPTGFRDIDRLTGGVVPGQLVIIAGRPSMGKTSLAVGMALRVAALNPPRRVVFFTLEMTATGLIERMISSLSHVPVGDVKGVDPDQRKLDEWYGGAAALAKLPILIHEGARTPQQQMVFLRQQRGATGVDVVVVDYLGLMSPGRRTNSRIEEITIISGALKRMAVEEHVAVVALSQLNRAVEGREGHRPRLSDLRDSGSIEQDADVVMLLHREDYYRRQADPATAEIDGLCDIIVAKNRCGPTGVAKLLFLEEYTRFEALAFTMDAEDAERNDYEQRTNTLDC